jgi:endonuclease/exonuclease/phosphatase family metal-dependent hydrolase
LHRPAIAISIIITVVTAIGCGWKQPKEVPDSEPTCMDQAPGTDEITWTRTEQSKHFPELNAWCRAVGPPYVKAAPASPVDVALDSIAVVVWNCHSGNGDIDALLDDVYSGALTGRPEVHFVVLLQEAVRRGPEVPASIPPYAFTAKRIVSDNEKLDKNNVVAVAERYGLSCIYVPSMRNGNTPPDQTPDDRGNAILSTLALHTFSAIELPLERQRRVAVGAVVSGRGTSGNGWELKFVNVHLDTRSNWWRFGRSFGVARLHQAKALVAATGVAAPIAIGGDFNNWSVHEPVIHFMDRSFDFPERVPRGATADGPSILPSKKIDHMFFNLPAGWSARYRILGERYGSDHAPMLGWVNMRESPAKP